MSGRYRLYLLAVLGFAAPFGSVLAQSVEELGAQQSERQLRDLQQQQQLEERLRVLEELKRSLEKQQSPPAVPPETLPAREHCFTIRQIELSGTDNLAPSERDALVAPYLNQCLSLSDIDALRSAIDQHYISRGWIMARTYLVPNQNIKGGVLQFKVLEGRLGEIHLDDNSFGDRLMSAMAFPRMVDEVIQLRDIEQGMDQINRLQSNRATMSIEPLDGKPGYSRILIKNTVTDAARVSMGADNQGSRSNGRDRMKLSLEIDNLLSLNEAWSLSANESVDGGDGRESSGHSILLSIPYGYWTYTLSRNTSDYVSQLEGAATPTELSGDSTNDSLKIARLVHRDQNSKTTLSGTLTRKDSDSFLEDVKLETSSRTLTVFDVGVAHLSQSQSSSWSIQADYSRGLDVLGGDNDVPGVADSVPKVHFEKLNWNFTYSTQIPTLGSSASYQGTLAGQLANDSLFGSEQISIGDLYTVRGFRDSSVAGDTGVYLRNDLSWSLNPLLSGLRITTGLDAGQVETKSGVIANSDSRRTALVGYSLGLSQHFRFLSEQSVSWSITLSIPLQAPSFVDRESTIIQGSLNLKWL